MTCPSHTKKADKVLSAIKKERRRFFFMDYECTVFSENNYGVMQQ